MSNTQNPQGDQNHLLQELMQAMLNQNGTPMSEDDIITHIMNTTDMSHLGPPPASQLAIQELDEISIEKRHIDKKMQCSVCTEFFELKEYATQLPCKHWFHTESCLHPWLKLHNSCPMCRAELPTLNYEYDMKKWEEKQKKNENDYSTSKNYPDYIM